MTDTKYRADIDGLRAIAVLAVVIFHAFPFQLPGGFVGVDVFFVISGYLITSIILENVEAGRFSFSEFYSRRVRRIFPALLLMLAAVYVFGWYTLFAEEFKQIGKHISGAASFVANIVLWRESGYFDDLAEAKPLLHMWSLGVEEQFYILWPLIIWVGWKARFNTIKISFLIAATSFAWNVFSVRGDAVAAFYSPQSRFWELMVGSILAQLTLTGRGVLAPANQPAFGRQMRDAQSVIGAVLIVSSVFILTKASAFPGWWATLPVFGALLIISAGNDAWFNRVILSNHLLVWVGLISYPLYLWHWPLLSLSRIIIGETPSAEVRTAAIAMSIFLAWATYRFVEKPVRLHRFRAGFLVVLLTVFGIVGYSTFRYDGLQSRDVVQQTQKARSQLVAMIPEYTTNDACLRRFPFTPAGTYWFCALSKDSSPTVLLLGNSFANHHFPGLSTNPAFKDQVILSIGVCDAAAPANEGEPDYVRDARSPCAVNNKLREQRLIDDIVVSTGTIRFALVDGLARLPTPTYIERLKERIDFLEKNGVKVIVFIPHFKHHVDISSCFARPLQNERFCKYPASERTKLNEDFSPLVSTLHRTNPNVLFFDPNSLFCDDKECSPVKDGMPLYRDLRENGHGGHLSVYGSVELANIFADWARKNAPGVVSSAAATGEVGQGS